MENIEVGLRLDAIAQHLGLGKRWKGPSHEKLAVEACTNQIRNTVDLKMCSQSEAVAAAVARTHQVRFAEVRNLEDLSELENFYLREQKELAFGLLREELANPRVEALLIQRRKAEPDAPDRWVAVLNSTRTADRAFWNKFHELGHRLAEPPQLILPLWSVRRELSDNHNALERLIDQIAGEIAFLPELTRIPLEETTRDPVSIQAVETFRSAVAPTASLLATINAFISRHPRLAIAFQAALRTRASGEPETMDLRVSCQGKSTGAVEGHLSLIQNMRVPHSSSVWGTFCDGIPRTALEAMVDWRTSKGLGLRWNRAIISSVRLGNIVYGTMEILA